MNYLGHAYLSFGDKDILTGNMIGDHVKGRIAMEAYPERIRQGIMLHRKIDGRTDMSPATARAKLLFREHYGLYSGPITDIIYDHFLANDPKCFASEKALLDFTLASYEQIAKNESYLPPKFKSYFPHMREHNWLYNYRHVKGIERSLNGLAKRALYMPPIDKAYQIFITHYYQLNQCYYEVIDDISIFVKNELGI